MNWDGAQISYIVFQKYFRVPLLIDYTFISILAFLLYTHLHSSGNDFFPNNPGTITRNLGRSQYTSSVVTTLIKCSIRHTHYSDQLEYYERYTHEMADQNVDVFSTDLHFFEIILPRVLAAFIVDYQQNHTVGKKKKYHEDVQY